MKIALASASKLKVKAIQNCGQTCVPFHVEVPSNPPQPYGFESTLTCAKNRLKVLKEMPETQEFQFLMAIENGIYQTDGPFRVYYDFCHVCLYDRKLDLTLTTKFFQDYHRVPVPEYYIESLINDEKEDYINNLGFQKTVGEDYAIDLNESGFLDRVYPNNWMKVLGVDRLKQMAHSVEYLLNLHPVNLGQKLKNEIRLIPDYPTSGVLFQDWMSLFSQSSLCSEVVDLMALIADQFKPDFIAGPELRGAMLGPLVAQKMKLPFITIRKKGKLPPPTISIEYQKEYGSDVLEINPTQVKGKKGVLIDDVLATGGSLKACLDLIEKSESQALASILLNDIPELREKAEEQLEEHPVLVLMRMI